jgi:pilus assembly protein CpaC
MLSDNSLYLIGLAPGGTSLIINDRDGNVAVDCKIRVTYPLKAIKAAIIDIHPDADVEIMSLDSSVILKGKVPSPEIAEEIQNIVGKFIDKEKIVNKLSVETSTQVMLKVKIAEVSRDLTKSLGINWRAMSAAHGVNGPNYGFVTGDSSSFLPNIADAESYPEEILRAEGPLSVSLKGGRWLTHFGGDKSLSGLIDALASESFASVLAEPTIVALSGKTATFKSGGEQGYNVVQPGATNTVTTEFKDWGTSIEFTPVVLSENRINITVTPKVSTLSFNNGQNSAPSLTTKEATTTVELGSGQSLAIAGLLQESKNTSSSETPFLADIPLIGMLFRGTGITVSEKEIVIIVTPYIVKPSSKQLKAPNDMVPRMYSPLESLITRRFHEKTEKFGVSAGFSLK